MSILIVVFTALLLFLSAFVVLIILMQKPSANAGMGSALGGGAAEQAFGGNAANVLTKTTVFAIIGFFILSFALYLGNLKLNGVGNAKVESDGALGSLVSNLEDDAETPEEPQTPVVETLDAEAQEAAKKIEESAASLDDVLSETPPVTTPGE